MAADHHQACIKLPLDDGGGEKKEQQGILRPKQNAFFNRFSPRLPHTKMDARESWVRNSSSKLAPFFLSPRSPQAAISARAL